MKSPRASILKRKRATARELARAVGKARKRRVFLLLRADGKHFFGSSFPTFERRSSDFHLVTSLPWSSIAGSTQPPSQHDVFMEMSRSFDWSDLIIRCAKAVVELRGGKEHFANLALSLQTEHALTDDWPLALYFPSPAELLQELHRIAPSTSTATIAGFLTMMSLALRKPWGEPERKLLEPKASQRFRRLGMICTDLADPPTRSGPYKIARVLLDVFRTRVFERAAPRLVRAHRMYVELLCEAFPDVHRSFEMSVGMTINTWIVGLCTLHDILQHRTIIDAGESDDDIPALRAVHRLAVDPSWFQEALSECRLDTVTPLRESPILRLGSGRYLVLHQDFLITAADEGVVARLYRENPSQRARLGQVLGEIFQTVVSEDLQRCFGSSNVHNIPTAKKRGEPRCDFAVVCGEDLLLIDAKRLLLGDKVIDGIDDIGCLAPVLQYGADQIIQTAESIRSQGIESVVPTLAGWNPRRFLGWVVVQPDLPFSYESRYSIITTERDRELRWRAAMTGFPCVVPIASVGYLEAAGQSYTRKFLDCIANDSPLASVGVPQFLTFEGYNGPQYSDEILNRYRKLLSRSKS